MSQFKKKLNYFMYFRKPFICISCYHFCLWTGFSNDGSNIKNDLHLLGMYYLPSFALDTFFFIFTLILSMFPYEEGTISILHIKKHKYI